jgi:hypothetical protein
MPEYPNAGRGTLPVVSQGITSRLPGPAGHAVTGSAQMRLIPACDGAALHLAQVFDYELGWTAAESGCIARNQPDPTILSGSA